MAGERERESNGKPPARFHPPSNIPKAPKAYVAHPYVLLQTAKVIGREDELDLLTDWIAKNEQVPLLRIFRNSEYGEVFR
jgi:hypothetical protein